MNDGIRDLGFGIRKLHGPRGAAALEVGRFYRIGDSLPQVLVARLQAIDDHLEHLLLAQTRSIDVVERHGFAVDEQPAEPFALERIQSRSDSRATGTAGTIRTSGTSGTLFGRFR